MSTSLQASEQPSQADTFFVYIVESPSAADLYDGRSEGHVVADALRLDSIPCVTRTAINSNAFVAALRTGLPDAIKQFPGRYPILHLSSHGSAEGLQLSSGDLVSWASLRDLLVPVNTLLQGGLLLCMSTCKGYSACQMAMDVEDTAQPYFAMVGNHQRPTWSDTAISYLVFYHSLSRRWTISEAVESMKIASRDPAWDAKMATEIKKDYIESLKNRVELGQAQLEFEAVS